MHSLHQVLATGMAALTVLVYAPRLRLIITSGLISITDFRTNPLR